MGRETAMGDAKPRRVRCIDSDSDAPEETSREEREEEEEEEEEMVETEEFEDTEEDEAETGAGLAREELQRERLHAGDTIEYYSMAFVFGDPRGHCVAKVLKVMKHETEYPLRLDSQEMLPSTQMIKRKANRRGEELAAGSAVWRKIRTFRLVDGRVKGPTRANRLNEGMKQAMAGAFAAVRKEVINKDTPPPNRDATSSNTSKKDGKISSFFSKKPVAAAPSPSKSYKRERTESTSSKPLEKRPRIALTPPARGEKDRKPPLAASSQSASRHRDHDKKRLHDRSSPQRSRDPDRRPHKSSPSKFSLLKFVNQIEEKKRVEKPDLNTYLAQIEEKKKREQGNQSEPTKTEEVPRRMTSSSGSSGVSRMRPGGSGESSRWDKKPGKMRALENFFVAPPRAHPTATKSQDAGKRASNLSFIMDNEPPNPIKHERRDGDERTQRRDSSKSKSPKKTKQSQASDALKKPLMDRWTSSKKR